MKEFFALDTGTLAELCSQAYPLLLILLVAGWVSYFVAAHYYEQEKEKHGNTKHSLFKLENAYEKIQDIYAIVRSDFNVGNKVRWTDTGGRDAHEHIGEIMHIDEENGIIYVAVRSQKEMKVLTANFINLKKVYQFEESAMK